MGVKPWFSTATIDINQTAVAGFLTRLCVFVCLWSPRSVVEEGWELQGEPPSLSLRRWGSVDPAMPFGALTLDGFCGCMGAWVHGRVEGIASWAVAWLAVFMAFLVRGGRQSVQVGLLRVPLYSCPVLAPECRAAPS